MQLNYLSKLETSYNYHLLTNSLRLGYDRLKLGRTLRVTKCHRRCSKYDSGDCRTVSPW